jgi:hypothetical protein
LPENERDIRDSGFEFESIEPEDLPKGTLGRMMREMNELSPLAAMRLQGRFDKWRYDAILQRGPSLVEKAW